LKPTTRGLPDSVIAHSSLDLGIRWEGPPHHATPVNQQSALGQEKGRHSPALLR
jgi:hypothetical protein